jgi:hypothetical protein
VTAPAATTPPADRARCRDAEIPPAAALKYGQALGWDCYACGKTLTTGAIHVGRAVGRDGAHVLDCDVYACP